MEFVVDTNVIFSALIADGKTREIIITEELDLYVPEFFFDELNNNLNEVEEKTGLERRDLDALLNLLSESMHVTPREEFEDQLAEARDLMADVDPDDVPFLALALHLEVNIWTDDEHFQEQNRVAAWKTHEVVEKLQ